MENFKRSIEKQIAEYTAEIQRLRDEIMNANKLDFIDKDGEAMYIWTRKRDIETMEETMEEDKKALIEIEEYMKNPPRSRVSDEPKKQEVVEEKVVRKTFEEEMDEVMKLRMSDSWKLLMEGIVSSIDDTYKTTIKGVIKEYRNGFDKAMKELIAFINNNLTKDRSIGINKNVINSCFNAFDRYIEKVVYKAALTADPPEGDDADSVKVCARNVMKCFNKMIDVTVVIEEKTKDFEEAGITVKKVIEWIDTISKDEWYDVNDLVESYNDFHHTVINSRIFGKLMKDKFDTKRARIKTVLHTLYCKK